MGMGIHLGTFPTFVVRKINNDANMPPALGPPEFGVMPSPSDKYA
jgi:hypothetical protein